MPAEAGFLRRWAFSSARDAAKAQHMFYTYIRYSSKMKRFYIGSTEHLLKRLDYHNAGYVAYTSRDAPWLLVWSACHVTRTAAVQLEKKIKNRGARRYLQDLAFDLTAYQDV